MVAGGGGDDHGDGRATGDHQCVPHLRRYGTLAVVSGSNFGTEAASSALWLGTKPGAVLSWTDNEIAATVEPGSQSGTVQVRQDTGHCSSLIR